MPDGPRRTRPGSPCPDAPIGDGFLLDRLGGRFTVLAIGAVAEPVQEGSTSADLLHFPADGPLAERYGQGVYLIRPDQHVAARWEGFDAESIRTAIRRATGNQR